MEINTPYILEENKDFAVVFKPPKMHTAAKNISFKQRDSKNESHLFLCENNTLLDWYSANSSSVFDVMHRLDFETHGLVLFAKNKSSYEYFKFIQDRGEFKKEYSAVCVPSGLDFISGFPAPPVFSSLDKPFTIESWFRPFGPGRKLVRPVIEDGKKHREIAADKESFYKTEILKKDGNVFTAQIMRGFRHQIRCHLCWIGFPVKNDPLYPQEKKESPELALRAQALFFFDPAGEKREIRIDALIECG
ncbi:MAG: pseudouridine synthase [Treponema sp.]|nr:pseudouridine synthase [Treponema sp.]MCL2271424.1 pseudouridine synthase [Treponema sp.]